MMSFQERAKLGMKELSKQLPITLEKAKKQLRLLRAIEFNHQNIKVIT